MNSKEIRRIFLDYFAKHQHTVIPSASLLPNNDPTLFFVNSGMVPFKDIFTGKEKSTTKRATTVQRSLRVSGKHNDLEEVGRTPRHHTFFEMLGNFSFGDYFKREAITMAWELLTKEYKLNPEKLWVTVFENDDEAELLWKEISGLPDYKIQRLGEKDNFWSMGDTGPCGPCSEIHYDHGPAYGDDPNGPQGGTNRYVEIWNLVFMQYERDSAGNLHPLPNPSIDTGMGLERLAAIKQGVYNNYDTDIFQSVIHTCASLAKTRYGASPESDVALRVIADHTRAVTFLVADGVMPSNEGRGYVLRRIARRAIRYGVKLGLERNFLATCAQEIIKEMGEAYPIIQEKASFVLEVIETEESRFRETLDRGLQILENAFVEHTHNNVLSGDIVFQLHDTFGFPLDLTRLIASEKNIDIDEAGYEKNMAEQKALGRANWKGADAAQSNTWTNKIFEGMNVEFTGYTGLEGKGTIVALLNQQGELVSELTDAGSVILHSTSFYGESGGQTGDVGTLQLNSQEVPVVDTQKVMGKIIEHKIAKPQYTLRTGDVLTTKVDEDHRLLTRRNHTATHLLHAALRSVLGTHVQQKGSLVTPQRLRFDFSHHKPVSQEELLAIEALVQKEVERNQELHVEVCSMDEAKEKGAMALFGEKYGSEVRMVQVPNFSTELCGGTHVEKTGEIGLFHIISETGISAGVRRIEALTSQGALQWYNQRSALVEDVAKNLRSTIEEIPTQLQKILEEKRKLEKEIDQLRKEIARNKAGDLSQQVQMIKGIPVIAAEFQGDVNAMREEADRLRNQLGSVLVILASGTDGAKLLVAATKDLVGEVHAGNIIRKLAPFIGGGGGGRPDMAQAGGNNVDGIANALQAVPNIVTEMLP